MTQLTSTGYRPSTLAEIRSRIESIILALPAYGPGTDLSAEGPLGQIIATQANEIFTLENGAQELYTSRDPDGCTGTSVDELFSELGSVRLPATPAYLPDVLLWGTPNTSFTVPAASLVKASTLPVPEFSLQSDVMFTTGTTGPFRGVRLQVPGDLAAGNVLSVQLNGNTYTYTVLITDTKATALAALGLLISNGIFQSTGSAEYESLDGADFLRIEGQSFTLNTYSGTYFTLAQVAQKGIFFCTTVGQLSVPALSVDTILTPVTNWLGVLQPAAAVAGTEVETDTAYKLRARRSRRTGTATDEALTQALYEVPGVSLAVVLSNRENVTDSEGRPAHSFEAVVSGGNDADIGPVIALKHASGIKSWGTRFPDPGQPYTVPSGRSYLVNWSVPGPVYAWVEVTITTIDPDGGLPDDYQAAIKNSIALYGAANFGLGSNFKLQQMYSAVYAVKGIYSATLRIATTATEGGLPVYGTDNIAVDARHFLVFDPARVVVIG